jgi:hypothetical protein
MISRAIIAVVLNPLKNTSLVVAAALFFLKAKQDAITPVIIDPITMDICILPGIFHLV